MTRSYDDWKLESPPYYDMESYSLSISSKVYGYNNGEDEEHIIYEGDDPENALEAYINQQSILEETHANGSWGPTEYFGDCEVMVFSVNGKEVYRLVFEEKYE